MREIFELSFSGINLIPTILLVFVILYWITVFFGLLETSSIDIDLHPHVHVHVEPHAHIHVDTHIHHDLHTHIHDVNGTAGGPNFFVKTLLFFNVGKIPFMILLSFIALPLWIVSMIFNYYTLNNSIIFSLFFLVPEFILSMFIAKIFTNPIAGIFKKIEDETGTIEDFVGKTAIVRVMVERERDGQIELSRNNSNILLIARSREKQILIGETVIIIEHNEEENFYIVEPY